MSKLLINEPPLQVLPSLAKAYGLNEAIFIQQLHYWLLEPKSGQIRQDGRKWIWNGYPDWITQFTFWSPNTIYRTVRHLEKLKIISTEQEGTDRRKWYTLNYDQLELPSPQVEGMEALKLRGWKPSTRGDGSPQPEGMEALNLRGCIPSTRGDASPQHEGLLNRNHRLPENSSETSSSSSEAKTPTPAEVEFFRQFGKKKWNSQAQLQRFQEAEKLVGQETMLEVVRWAAGAGISDVNKIYTAASKWQKGHNNGNRNNARQQPGGGDRARAPHKIADWRHPPANKKE